MQELVNRAKELLADGTVERVLGWKAGDLPYNPEPAYFYVEEDFAIRVAEAEDDDVIDSIIEGEDDDI